MTQTITFRGPAPLAGRLAQSLRDAGGDVTYTPPMERRGVDDVARVVVEIYVGGITWDATKYTVGKFRERFGSVADVDVADED